MSFHTLQDKKEKSKSTAATGLLLPSPEDPGEGVFLPKNREYSLIHGNKDSTPHKQGLRKPFDDFNPDYSHPALIDRLKRYATAHSRALEMSKYIRQKYKVTPNSTEKLTYEKALAIATELKVCGSYLIFHYFHTVNLVKLASMCSCKRHLICPLCAIRRAAKTVQVYMEKYNLLIKENPHLLPYLVTFTIKDGKDLEERFLHLQNSLRLYYSHRAKVISGKGRHKPNEANKASGGVGSYEVKKGSGSGLWHPHSHFIWLCDSVPDKKIISSEWHQITVDSFVVDVTPFYDPQDVSKGFLEVFKYALKYSDMDLSDNWEAFTILQRRRLVTSFGNFRGIEIPEQMTDEITEEELPYVELVFRYLNGNYHLINAANPQTSERSE